MHTIPSCFLVYVCLFYVYVCVCLECWVPLFENFTCRTQNVENTMSYMYSHKIIQMKESVCICVELEGDGEVLLDNI